LAWMNLKIVTFLMTVDSKEEEDDFDVINIKEASGTKRVAQVCEKKYLFHSRHG